MTFLTYENPKRGISIKYPEDWEIVEDEWLIDLAFTAPFERGGTSSTGTTCEQSSSESIRGSVVVSVEDLSNDPMSLEEFTNLSLSEIKKDEDMEEILEQDWSKLAEEKAYRIVCIIKKANFKLKFLQLWTIIKNKLYSVSYSHAAEYFSKYRSRIEEMVNSFEII